MNTAILTLIHPGFLIWLAQILYFICFIPQIVVNYRLKSGKGLNDLFMLAYLNTLLALLFYTFCLDLPAAYKFMYPLQTLATIVLIFQRLFYDSFNEAKYYWFLYGLNLIIPLLLVPYASTHCNIVGHITGWIFCAIGLVNQLPLVLKIMRTKSVEGISFNFLLITGIAGIIESYTVIKLGLPLQTILGALRVVAFFVIFCIQFLLYKNKNNA